MKQQQKTISNLSRKPTQTTQQQKTTLKTLKKTPIFENSRQNTHLSKKNTF